MDGTIPRFASRRASTALALLILCGFAVVSTAISGCSCGPTVDTSLLTDDPCAAPCWNNVIPGVSGEEEVRSQLVDSPFVRKGSLGYGSNEQAGASLTTFSWRGQSRRTNWIDLQDGKVLRIHLNLDYDLTLGEIVRKYGPPEAVYATLLRTGELRYYIVFEYPAQGLSFSTSYPISHDDAEAEARVYLSEDLVVTHVTYFAPTSLPTMLSAVFLFSSEEAEYHMANRWEWDGYGYVKLAEESE